MIEPDRSELRRITIDQQVRDSAFHGALRDEWISGYLFFDKVMTPALHELLDSLSMWGGPSKYHPEHADWIGWEFSLERIRVVKTILSRLHVKGVEEFKR